MNSIYSLLSPLVRPLTWLLETLHFQLGIPWGWSIVTLTVIVRVAMIPLTVKQQQSFRAMQALQPEIKKLQAKYKNDRQKLNEEMMAFYKENKVNPFGSCLPLLIQLPIFFALYATLRDISKEVTAGENLSMFGGWIPDITASLNSLPATTLYPLMFVYVISQMGSTLLMPTSVDPKQKYIFLFLPIVFAYFIVHPPIGASSFPVGLLVYWITTNLWTVGQAFVIRQWFPPPLPPSAKAQPAKSGGGLTGLLGRSTPSNQMPKAKKPKAAKPAKVATTNADEGVDDATEDTSTESAPANDAPTAAPKNKAQRQKRPAKPPREKPKDA
ncbi:MAG: YidC/Oxa1 family membrane protein insertase [Gaiellales bacterium]